MMISSYMMLKSVPREKVPWFPTIDPAKCDGCRVCVDYCNYAVYGWDEDAGRANVIRPFGCVVGCSGCQPLCPVGAISFPDIEAVQAVIRRLREEGDG